MVSFEVRDGMEEELTLETDLTRHHHVLKEGDKFERSFLRLDRCFLALLRVNTHLVRAFRNDLKLPSVEVALQEENAS